MTANTTEFRVTRATHEGWRVFSPTSLPFAGELVLVLAYEAADRSSRLEKPPIVFPGYLSFGQDAFGQKLARGFCCPIKDIGGLFAADRVIAWMRLPSTRYSDAMAPVHWGGPLVAAPPTPDDKDGDL